MNKTLSEAKMHRSRFLNKYLRNKTDENTRKYKKKQNYYVSPLKKLKTEYYGNVDVKKLLTKKRFRNFFLSGKIPSTPKITLIENDKIVRNYNDTARALKTFFSNIVPVLITRDCSNRYIWLIVIFCLETWNLSNKSS